MILLVLGKVLFRDGKGQIHWGMNPPSKDFVKANKKDVEKALKTLGSNKLWRCTVCCDMHLGDLPPEVCPTCSSTDAYVQIDEKEFRTVLRL